MYKIYENIISPDQVCDSLVTVEWGGTEVIYLNCASAHALLLPECAIFSGGSEGLRKESTTTKNFKQNFHSLSDWKGKF
jgi:hypothetical protein